MKKFVWLIFVTVLIFSSNIAYAHCDTLDDLIIKDAKIALEKADITPLLKWADNNSESEIQSAYMLAMAERSTDNAEVKQKVDEKFFEIVLRAYCQNKGKQSFPRR